MGSIAMDASGNMALGFSASSASMYPAIRYVGRLSTDPINTLPQAEVTLMAGTGAQTGSVGRWGDYSMMSVDPADDCTFWYTQEYLTTTGDAPWRTRIGSFKFPSCVAVLTPVVSAAGSTLTNENCSPANSVIDPGELVTVSFTVANVGSGATPSLVGTLLNTGGVTGASSAQTYGVIAAGASVSRSFSFTASETCGGTLIATLQMQDGATNMGNLTYTHTLGVLTTTNTLTEAFDGVTAPALPAGWTTAAPGAEIPWVTSVTTPFTSPNAAFAPNPATAGDTELVTPTFAVSASGAQLTFKNKYATEDSYDGMVLEISINGGAFVDITTDGNAFLSGGYNGAIDSEYSNPLAGRAAWTGDSEGYITSSINLPTAALGQNVRLKWRMGSDWNWAETGVRIDSITIGRSVYVCSSCSSVAFTDPTLTVGLTAVKAVHVTELRTRIDEQRVRFGLGVYPWAETVTPVGTVLIKAVHVTEMRTALGQAYT
ncbi:MAG: hypothetical protein WCI74_22255, partial [Actinomycetes bacterium]